MLIKICGITDATLAYQAAKAGAHYIGLIRVAHSKRVVQRENVDEIVRATRLGGAEPVAIFSEANASEIIHFCELFHIHHVQLHGYQAKKAESQLPENLHRIYVCEVGSHGKISAEDIQQTSQLNPQRDFLLFDSPTPGSGLAFDWQHFSYSGDFRWFLAGGLQRQNVAHAIQSVNPDGVDVSSGVENAAGEKTLQFIADFIKQVSLC
ncbi:MAG: phosphoribosylanthranilate isomerase [Gammaproteobacteria bacterium]